MSNFEVKSPGCGIVLAADENYIGAWASCSECNCHFILEKGGVKFPPESVEQIISFAKKLDWSTLTVGVTIPLKFHDAFRLHLSIIYRRKLQ